jgi:amidase
MSTPSSAPGTPVGLDLCYLTASQVAARIQCREVSARQVLDADLAQIERYNPTLTAVVSLDHDRARERADAADAALASGEVWGPLHGVPMTLKDAHEVAGLRTTVGTVECDRIAETDGAVAARLRAAGANIIGHTNVAAWLADFNQSSNPVFGSTANPWDPKRTPGGSSGGAAAALAAGMTPLEVGSDMAGSLRMPAHFCGVYGLKPTEHRVPMTGFFRQPFPVPRSVRIISCLGPMARDLDDLELGLRIISGPDAGDTDVPPVPLLSEAAGPLRQLRLAVAPTLPGVTVASDIRARVEQLASAVAATGAMVEDQLPRLDWAALPELFGSLVSAITSVGDPRAEQRSLAWYFEMLDRRDQAIAAWERFFDDFDALILPAAMTTAFTHREPGASVEIDSRPVPYWTLARLLIDFNLTGLPALVVPAGLDQHGLPIGVQIVAPRWSEMRLLRIARQLEEAHLLPGFQRPPGY